MASFLATILLTSPVAGNICFLYSTSLDRAQEVLRAAKTYVGYILKKKHPMLSMVKIARDNERLITIDTGIVQHTVMARPKNVASCRGDNPETVRWRTAFLN